MPNQAQLHSWKDIPKEELTPLLHRQIINGEKMMFTRILLKKDCVVPKHHHENEQITHVISGKLKFLLGENQDEEVIVSSGEVLVIPSNLPHSATALEDTIDIDVFCPPRQDWLDGSDDYIRRGNEDR